MTRKWRNIFFMFGVSAVVVMLLTFKVDYTEILSKLRQAGLWFPLVVVLWLVIYIMNAVSWQLIIRDGKSPRVPFQQVLKMTISGFALNYTTPFGLMGGEPYRIMELSGYVGTEKATSSVLLYVMMHISSHFGFWLSGIVIYVFLGTLNSQKYPLGLWMFIVLAILTVVFIFVTVLFSRGFRHGFVVKVFGLLGKLPFIGKWALSYRMRHLETLQAVDGQIAYLHTSRRTPFWGSWVLEFLARYVSCIEYWLLLRIMMPSVTYLDSVLIMAFSSLFSNILFFSPMQLGSREGGLALASGGLSIPSSYGLFTALMTRLRELFWIIVGVAIMKIRFGKR